STVTCPNVNFDFSTILQDVLDEAVPRSHHPVILKLSPDYDYLRNAAQAARAGVAGLTAINTVKALRLDPRTGQPVLANRFGGLWGGAVKPIGLRVVAELRDAGVTLPIIATGGIRTVDDCREYFWAGADAVSLGSAALPAGYRRSASPPPPPPPRPTTRRPTGPRGATGARQPRSPTKRRPREARLAIEGLQVCR